MKGNRLAFLLCILPSVYTFTQSAPTPLATRELLGRPTDTSITVSIAAGEAVEVFAEYGREGNVPTDRTALVTSHGADPFTILIAPLQPDTSYIYRLSSRRPGESGFTVGPERTFHTARPPGSSFSFAVEADPHMDENTNPELFARSLQNVLNYHPDLLIDLGDSFMSEKSAKSKDQVLARHLLLRSYWEQVCHSVPLFLVLGNHEGETSGILNGTDNNIAVWATTDRKQYFPNPEPDDFYSGDSSQQPFVGSRQSIYAWEWGDVLFVVLDPYWFTTGKGGGGTDNWVRTLCHDQYLWLQQVLTTGQAKYKLVFIHNLVGGLDSNMRGGAEAAPLYEWGGHNADGSWGFDGKRPGWGRPIHDLLVSSGVNVVFHGHDHMYARQELDGIVYQEVPQPGWPGLTLQNPANYGYTNGVLLPSSGHVRVSVSPDRLTVDYVKTYLAKDENATRKNGDIAFSYTIQPKVTPRIVRRHLGRVF